LSYSCFYFLLSLDCSTAIHFRAELGTILTRRFEESGLASADSGLQLDLGDRAKRCFSEDPALWLIQPRAEDKLKLSDDVI